MGVDFIQLLFNSVWKFNTLSGIQKKIVMIIIISFEIAHLSIHNFWIGPTTHTTKLTEWIA